MKQLILDLETYSGADLTKTGVYGYVDSPDFEILLFGFSVDKGPVSVIDLKSGEKIPEEVIKALEDQTVYKSAFNAQFERICLSKHLGVTLAPESWRCTMVASLYLGLPGSLAAVGEVLGVEKQKLTVGKDLIRFFSMPCKPTKANEMRTRNLPEDAPDKWEMYKTYNARDVETELEIQSKLGRFPVPEDVWQQYCLDQRINDAGIELDMKLVQQAICCDEESRARYLKRAQELTGLENPNSPIQLKEWLQAHGVELESLAKAEVNHLLQTATGEPLEVLQLRQMLAKSSVKKYSAMESCVCSNGRAHGLLQFYGANRTGRWCLTGDHEVLTENGWECLEKWEGGKIACWNPIGETVSFQNSKAIAFPYNGLMYEYSDKRISQVSTPDHKMYIKQRYNGDWKIDTVENMEKYRPSIPFTGYRRTSSGMEHNFLRVLVMVQADGSYTNEGNIRLTFYKERKVSRCKELLRAADIMYSLNTYYDCTKKRYVFVIYARHMPIWLRMFQDKTFGTWLFDESADVFFDELVKWDGYRSAKNSIQYCTCNKQNADMVQAFAHITGRCALIKVKKRKEENLNWNKAYIVDIWLTPKNCHEIKSKPVKHEYEGNVFCAETPTGFFMVRRNGKVWVTGNSGRLVQVQNLPQNHMPDLKVARDLVKSGCFEALDLLYDSTPNVLSELIRTAFVPKAGCKFMVADFSAIEARVIAWLAGEKWRMEVFKNNGDIYCASASQMFGVPVEKHGVNGHLRQKGKISELALGYGGSTGALISMGALDMGLNEDELKPLVDAWRQSNPAIVQLWWDVDKAVIQALKEKKPVKYKCLDFVYASGIIFIGLPSGRRLAYVKPRISQNEYGRDSITYEGVGTGKRWERIESYGPKFVENVIQAIARDILAEAMNRLAEAGYQIVMHVHDEVVMEAPIDAQLEDGCRIMSETPDWASGLILNAAGYECEFYQKD